MLMNEEIRKEKLYSIMKGKEKVMSNEVIRFVLTLDENTYNVLLDEYNKMQNALINARVSLEIDGYSVPLVSKEIVKKNLWRLYKKTQRHHQNGLQIYSTLKA